MGDPRRPIVARPIKVFLKTHTVEKIQTMGDLTRCPIVARPAKNTLPCLQSINYFNHLKLDMITIENELSCEMSAESSQLPYETSHSLHL